MDFALALLWEVQDGKLIRGEVHLDQGQALSNAGLDELAETWGPTQRAGGRRFRG